MDKLIDNSWNEFFKEERTKQYFRDLEEFVEAEYTNEKIKVFPEYANIFAALKLCSLDEVKVVILGQDPYPTAGHANGLCFSVEPTVNPLPRSLNNIFSELQDDVNVNRQNGDLTSWAKQGVLLLNNVLTVREGLPDSHSNKGWELFTDAIIEKLNEKQGIVYLLWGSKAQKKASLVNQQVNYVLSAPHPSPLSAYRGFFGCKHFSKTNEYLRVNEQDVINW